jgi:hypothetical protein
MKNGRYVLDSEWKPVLEPDLFKWAEWFETTDRMVKVEKVGDCEVSTVFLGLDHAFGDGPAVLRETMVFGGALDQEQERCSGLRADAEAMHKRMVERVTR